MNTKHAKRTFLITGASQGLGLALSETFARDGASVVMVARSRERLIQEAHRLRNEGLDVHAFAFDVSAKGDAYRIAGAAELAVGPIDVLVHNASALGPTPLRPLGLGECEDFEDVLETNVVGPFRLTKALLPSLTRPGARSPALVFISSDAASEAYPSWGFYGASKAAADHLARTFAAEHAGLRVVSFDPGEMDTAMHQAAIPDADRAILAHPLDVARALALRLESVSSGTRVVLQGGHHA